MLEKIQLDGWQLKWLAIITMTIDHIGAILFPECISLRIIGRIAFPIFAFLLAQGMMYTKNTHKYLLRLGVFAMISEIPFDYGFQNCIIDMQHQNIFFTLLLGGAAIYVIQQSSRNECAYLGAFGIALLGDVLNCDYGSTGIIIIVSFYVLKDKKLYQYIALIVCSFIMGYIQIYAILAIVPIYLYNGTRGKGMKWLFYVYYPLHLLAIKGIWIYINWICKLFDFI